VAWGFPGSRAVFVLSRCVSRCAAVSPCIAVITDIWRTESGRSKRFGAPLAPAVCHGWPSSVKGLQAPKIAVGRRSGSARLLGSAGSRRNLQTSGRLGPWLGRAPGTAAVYCPATPGSGPRLPSPRMAHRMQRLAGRTGRHPAPFTCAGLMTPPVPVMGPSSSSTGPVGSAGYWRGSAKPVITQIYGAQVHEHRASPPDSEVAVRRHLSQVDCVLGMRSCA
jgi:hypothetical protein